MKIRSNFIDGISGSVGGITGAGGLGGMYLKAKPLPSNPRTPQQGVVRSALRQAIASWQAGTPRERNDWRQYGRTCEYTNNTGSLVRLNGWNAYSRAYVVFSQGGVDSRNLITQRPALNGYLADLPLTLTQDTTIDTTLNIQNQSNFETNISLFMGQVTRPTINNYPFSFRWLQVATLTAGATLAVVDALSTGRNWLRVQSYTGDGQLARGQILFIDATVAINIAKKKK